MSQPKTTPDKVLYVEDKRNVQMVVSHILKMLGYEVACADNGQAGIEMALSWQPDVILMDVRMPVMNGLEATRALRAKPPTKNIPICIISAYTDAKTRHESIKAGANKFLTKPIDIDKLDATIQDMLKLVIR